MAITNFIPEIWAAQLQSSLKKALVFGGSAVVNRNYEGQIANSGDTVHITSITRPTIAPYVKNVTVIAPETLTDATRALVIDQAKYFAFEVDDVDMRQAANGGALLSEAADEAAYGLADTADSYIWGLMVAGTAADNQIADTLINTSALAVQGLIDLKLKLDEADVPQQGRFAVVPPWYHALLLGSDTFVRVDASGTAEALRDGVVGRAFGFNVALSNNIAAAAGTDAVVDDYTVVAGHPSAVTYAEQINKVEAYRPESAFSDAIKGLHLYGAKVVRPDALATLDASLTAVA